MLSSLLILVHLVGVVVWVGGMFFAYFCLRPAATRTLEPPQRLPLWVATFEPFFRYAAIAVVAILASGFVMLLQVGFALAPIGWHLMMLFGLAMSAVFGHVYLALYPRLRGQCAKANWPAAAGTLNSIRRLVGINLLLAAATIAAAALSR